MIELSDHQFTGPFVNTNLYTWIMTYSGDEQCVLIAKERLRNSPAISAVLIEHAYPVAWSRALCDATNMSLKMAHDVIDMYDLHDRQESAI